MRTLFVLLLLLLSLLLLGCIDKENSQEKVQQVTNQSIIEIPENTTSGEEIRTAIIEALEINKNINNKSEE